MAAKIFDSEFMAMIYNLLPNFLLNLEFSTSQILAKYYANQ